MKRYAAIIFLVLALVANAIGLYVLSIPNPTDPTDAATKQIIVVTILIVDVLATLLSGWPYLWMGQNPFPTFLDTDRKQRLAFLVGVILTAFLTFAILAAFGFLGMSIVPVIVGIAYAMFLVIALIALVFAIM